MKSIVFLTIGLFLLCYGNTSGQENSSTSQQSGTFSIMSTPELYSLTANWVNEYAKVNPGVKIRLVSTDDAAKQQGVVSGVSLSFLSAGSSAAIQPESAWKVVVGRDAIVPVFNSQNPFFADIFRQGVTPEALSLMFKSSEQKQWSGLLGKGRDAKLSFYYLKDESLKTGLARFLNLAPDALVGIETETESQILDAVRNDQYAIGFCRMSAILDKTSQGIVAGISLLPIDKNGNGAIDYKENIYDNATDFFRGVWIGKYPKSLCSNIYSVAGIRPTNAAEIAFLSWILNDGQQLLNDNGYYDLAYNERQTNLNQLVSTNLPIAASRDTSKMAKLVLLILAGLLIAGFLVDALIRYFMGTKARVPDASAIYPYVFNERSVDVPKGLYFDKTHTWAFMEKDGLVKIGIDDFLQHITGPLTQIRMKNAGETVRRGEQLVTIVQKGKQLNISAPVSGTIVAQNSRLIKDSSIINASPYSEGWVYMIEPANWSRETQLLSVAGKYREWLQQEFTRLKDFLVISVKPNTLAYSHIVLQDGGELNDSLLQDLGPEVWEDFQTKFIDTAK